MSQTFPSLGHLIAIGSAARKLGIGPLAAVPYLHFMVPQHEPTLPLWASDNNILITIGSEAPKRVSDLNPVAKGPHGLLPSISQLVGHQKILHGGSNYADCGVGGSIKMQNITKE